MISNHLIRICQTTHTTHNAKHIVVSGVHSNLRSVGSLDGGVGKNQLKSRVINTREIASSRWLMFLRAKSKGVDVDAFIWVAGMALVRLDEGEVSSFTFRETILSVKLQLGSNNWVLSPTVHVKRCFGEHKGASIRDGGLSVCASMVECSRRNTIATWSKIWLGVSTS